MTAADVYAARRVGDAFEALILEVDTPSLATITDWPSSRGFTVTPESLEAGMRGRSRIVLQLSDVRYRDVFRALCRDLSEVLQRSCEQVEAVRAFHQRLARWQSFLERHGPEGLSEEAQCGLFGELAVMRELLKTRLSPQQVLASWKGCKKAPQDFQFPKHALEVKTTRAVIADKVFISNVQQLDGEEVGSMHLAVVHVSVSTAGGETLPALVDTLLAKLPEPDLFDSGLEEVGYLEAHRSAYERTAYRILSIRHFAVVDGFPRMTLDQIPAGVKGVKYSIAIDACAPFERSWEALLEQVTRDSAG